MVLAVIEGVVVGKRLLVLVMVIVSFVASSVSVANATIGVASDSLSAAVSAIPDYATSATSTTSTTVPAKNVKTVKPVKPVKPKNKNVASAVGTTVSVIANVSNIASGTSGSSGTASVVVLPVEVPGLISVCVNKSTSVLRDTADNSCSSGSEVKVEWLDTGMSPKICVNNNNREMTLAQDGKCATKNSAVADVTANKQILACADDKTGVLRYRASGVCGTNTDPVTWELKDQGVARNVSDAVKTAGIQIISLIPTGAAGDSSGSTKTVTTSPTTNTSSATTTTTTAAPISTATTTTSSSTTTTTSSTTTTTVALRAVGSFAGYLGGTCPDGSGIPWYWGSGGQARAGGCSAAASIAPISTGSSESAATTTTTVAPVVVPGTPATPTGVAGNTQVTVSVTAGSGGTPTSYTITQSTTSGGTYTTGCTVTGASGSCVVTGLTNDTTYFFKTTATNSAGTSSLSVASSSVTPATVPGTPATPTGVAGNLQVTVSVTAGTGGTPTSYTVTQATTSGGIYTTGCTVTVPASSCVVTGLTNGTTYFFKTTATNSVGTSGLSVASTSVTPVATCAQGGPCVLGNTGPGGGIVFYVASGTFTQTSASGSMCTTACKYLEVAPQGWIVAATPAGQTNCGAAAGAAQGVDGTSTLDPFCMWSTNMTTTYGNSSGVIGAGYANTLTLLAAYNVVGTAAKVARAYQGGGLTDWFLPSQNELTEIYTRRASISGLANDYYWSSTEVDLQNGMLRQMSTGASFSSNRNNARAIRPIRAFG